MEADSLILDWEEKDVPLTPPQSDKGNQDNGPLYVFPEPAILGGIGGCYQDRELANANPWTS